MEHFSDAVELAEKKNCIQPSLTKWLAISKASLANELHLQGNHYDGNVVLGQALKLLGQLVMQFPDYPEGFLALASVQCFKVKWTLGKITFSLEHAQNLFKEPVHRKHVSDDAERKLYEQTIASLTNTVNALQQSFSL